MNRCRLKSCRKYGKPESMLKVPIGAFCNIEHAFQWAQENAAKARQKAKAKAKQQAKAHKQNDRQRQLELTQAAVNKLCLLLDKGLPCISCGRPDGGPRKRNASHFKSRGSNSFLRFDLANIHASCVVCNLYQSGNIEGYRSGLAQRHGSAMVDYLDSAPRVKDWTPQELIQLRRGIAAECRRLEKGEPASRDWRQIPQAKEVAI
jgi:hypothetical protein